MPRFTLAFCVMQRAAHADARTAKLHYRGVIVQGKFSPLLRLFVLVNIGDDGGAAVNQKYIRAEIENLGGHIGI